MKRNRRRGGENREWHRNRPTSFDFGDLDDLDPSPESSEAYDDLDEDLHRKPRFDRERWRDELLERSSERQRMRDYDVRRGLYRAADKLRPISDESDAGLF